MKRFFCTLFATLLFVYCACLAIDKKKVFKDDIVKEKDPCDGLISTEYFRLSDKDCKSVVRCSSQGMLALRCQNELLFDIELQVCNWRNRVQNCHLLTKPKLAKPLLSTDKPVCEPKMLACGNGECINQELFCNGVLDCSDGSDENICNSIEDPNRAEFCDPTKCLLPECFCSVNGVSIPGGLKADQVPQMVTITFDDAVNNNNIEAYQKIFDDKRLNPNKCSIKGTFFVSHKYTNYSAVQELHRLGHEIAVHSISHTPDKTYWEKASLETWTDEMTGVRKIIEKFANITDNSVIGMRGPNLRLGGNTQFTMLENEGFVYDSTISARLSNPPIWPYFLQYQMPHACYGDRQNCPTQSRFVWEMVMNEYDRRIDPDSNEHVSGCSMIDSCGGIFSGEDLYEFLEFNFDRHYKSNRAPFGIYLHASWFVTNPGFLESFIQWIDDTLAKSDVYFVSMTEVIKWIQKPTEVTKARDFEPWKNKCEVKSVPFCTFPNPCPLTTPEVGPEEIRLHTCMPCPQVYPWLKNPLGRSHF